MVSRAAILAAGASLATAVSHPVSRTKLITLIQRWSRYDQPGGIWRIVAILLALANYKNLNFVWHFRVFRAMLYHIYVQPTPIPPHALFQPIVTSTRTTMLEMDYNMHKSNSTYFSDMDVSRTHLFTAIIRNGILKDNRERRKPAVVDALGATEGTSSRHIVALGGISCLFKREILPYKKYEMWTRVLCWDRKWFYLITHFVKPGLQKPKSWTLQPWRKSQNIELKDVSQEEFLSSIHASAIAKYVIKKGRLTVAPEQVLVNCEMVPPKPEGWVYRGNESDLTGVNNDAGADHLPEVVQASDWNWDVIENERLRGLKVAQHFAELDQLHELFDAGKDGILGEYADMF